MIGPMQFSTESRFEMERMGRAIDATTHVPDLQKLCKDFLQAWQTQKAACAWIMRQGLERPWTSAEQVPHHFPFSHEEGAPAGAPEHPL